MRARSTATEAYGLEFPYRSGTVTINEPEAFPTHIAARHRAADAPQVGGDFSLDAVEREHITRVIARTATLDEAAAVLGIDASTLWRKRKKYEG